MEHPARSFWCQGIPLDIILDAVDGIVADLATSERNRPQLSVIAFWN